LIDILFHLRVAGHTIIGSVGTGQHLSPAGGIEVQSGAISSGDQGAAFMGYPLAFQADTPPFSALTLL